MPIYATFKKRGGPPAPSGLNSPTKTTTTVSLSWTNNHIAGSVDDIFIYQNSVIIAEVGGDEDSYVVTGLEPGTTYSFQVGASNADGLGISSALQVTTQGQLPVITTNPTNKSVEDGDTVSFQISATDALTYQWQVSTDGGSNWSNVSGATSQNYSFTASVSQNGYYYRCVASNDFGDDTSSNAILSVAAASGLIAVDDLAVAVITDSQCDLSWTDQSSGETAYQVYRDGTLIHTTAANASSYSDTGATPGSTHVYRVDVTDGVNTPLQGNQVTVKMSGPQIASNPTDEWIPDGGTAVFGVAMGPDQGSVTYQWEVSTDSGSSWSDVSGATSQYIEASYSSSDNGKLFRCKCTTGAGTVTSSSALLTVYAHTYHHDTYNVIEGWGFRKIRAAYSGNCCQIRDSNGVTHEIGWSGGKVDQTALEAAANGSRAKLVILYGQGPLGKNIDFSGEEPWITDASGNLLEEDGVPYWQGVGNNTYASADFTGNPIDADDISIGILFRFDYDSTTDVSGQASETFLTFGTSDVGLKVPTQLSAIQLRAAVSNPIGNVNLGRFSWLVGYSNGEEQPFFQGGNPCGVFGDKETKHVPLGSGHTRVNIGTLKGVRCSEIVLWSACTRAELENRMFLADRNYCIGPRDNAFKGIYPISKRAYKLCQWIADQDESDFLLPTVTAKTETTITVGGVDWSWVPIGQQVKVGTNDNGVDLTIQSAQFTGGNTVFSVTESTASVATGMECRVDPWWDGLTNDIDLAASIAINWRDISNTSRNMTDSGGNQRSSGFPAKWYTLQGDGSVDDLSPTEQAIIDEAAPSTTGLTGGISDDGTGHRAMLLRFDLTGVSSRPDTAWLRILDIYATDAVEPKRQLRVGVKCYQDLSWSASTVTWNSSPVTLSPKPTDWDDFGDLEQYRRERVFDVTEALHSAYDAGASTLTIAIYVINDLDSGAASTTREVEIRDVDLRIAYSSGQNITACGVPLQLDYQPDTTHHYGWGNEMLLRFDDSLPLADGRNGQPFYHNLAMLKRGLAVNLMGIVRQLVDQSATTDLRVVSGMVWIAGPTVKDGGPYLDEGTRRALEEMAIYLTETMRVSGNGLYTGQGNWNNANQCCKGLEGFGSLYSGIRGAQNKTTVSNNVRSAALGRIDGDMTSDPPVWDPQAAFLRSDGMVREGTRWHSLTPETDYLGRSWAHVFSGLTLIGNEAEAAWLRGWAKLLGEFVAANIFDESDGEYSGPSGYCGRTDGAPIVTAQYSWYSNISMAGYLDEEMLPFGRNMVTGIPETFTSLEAAINEAILNVNKTTYGRGWVFRSRVNNVFIYKDWPTKFYSCSYAWPNELAKSLEINGWHNALHSLINAGSASTYWLGTPNNWANGTVTFPKTAGEEDFISVRGGTGDERFKILIQGSAQNGEYGGGCKEGTLHMFWGWGYGGVVCSHKPLLTNKYGFPEGDYPAPVHQDAETLIGQHGTLVYGSEDGGPVLTSGAFGMGISDTRDNSARTCSWNGSDTLTTTKSLEQEFSYGFLESGDSLVQTKVYHVLNTADDGMEGLQCSSTLAYTSGAPKTVLQLYHNIPCFVSTTRNLGATLNFEYWTGGAWARVPTALLDTWLPGVQVIRLVKNKNDGNGDRYAWIILDSARKVRFPSSESRPIGRRIKRLQISIHPGTEGNATTLPSSTTSSWTITTTDPGYVVTEAVTFLLSPATSSDRPFEGEPWMLQGTVAWGPKTPGSVTFEYSTDYAGDEGAATWSSIGAATENDVNWEYYGGTVPSGVTGVRIKATASDASVVTDVLAVASKSPSAVLVDTFTDSNGTMLSAHTPDTNTTGNSYTFSYFEPDIQSNRADNAASGGKPDNGTFASIDVGTDNWVIKALVNTETANDSVRGPWLGMGVNRNTSYIKASVSTTGVHLATRIDAGIDPVITSFTSFTPSASTDYQLEVQRIGSSFGFRLLSADGLTEHSKGAVHNISDPAYDNGASFGISRNGTIDEVEILT